MFEANEICCFRLLNTTYLGDHLARLRVQTLFIFQHSIYILINGKSHVRYNSSSFSSHIHVAVTISTVNYGEICIIHKYMYNTENGCNNDYVKRPTAHAWVTNFFALCPLKPHNYLSKHKNNQLNIISNPILTVCLNTNQTIRYSFISLQLTKNC